MIIIKVNQFWKIDENYNLAQVIIIYILWNGSLTARMDQRGLLFRC
jgi:hypothetical protein